MCTYISTRARWQLCSYRMVSTIVKTEDSLNSPSNVQEVLKLSGLDHLTSSCPVVSWKSLLPSLFHLRLMPTLAAWCHSSSIRRNSICIYISLSSINQKRLLMSHFRSIAKRWPRTVACSQTYNKRTWNSWHENHREEHSIWKEVSSWWVKRKHMCSL